jgi:hypothetical protein
LELREIKAITCQLRSNIGINAKKIQNLGPSLRAEIEFINAIKD